MAKIRPLLDRVVVKVDEPVKQTAGGLYLPDTAQKKVNKGEVLAIGLGRKNREGQRVPLDVRVGDIVHFGTYAGSEIKVMDEDLLIIREDDILGVEEEARPEKSKKS